MANPAVGLLGRNGIGDPPQFISIENPDMGQSEIAGSDCSHSCVISAEAGIQILVLDPGLHLEDEIGASLYF